MTCCPCLLTTSCSPHYGLPSPHPSPPPPPPQAFLDGFWELIPRDLLSVFNDHELELLISGLPDIDVADMRANTEYQVGGRGSYFGGEGG